MKTFTIPQFIQATWLSSMADIVLLSIGLISIVLIMRDIFKKDHKYRLHR